MRAGEPGAVVLDLARHACDRVVLVLAGDEPRVSRQAVELARLDRRRRDDVPREEEPRILGGGEVVGFAGRRGYSRAAAGGVLLGAAEWRELLLLLLLGSLVVRLREMGRKDCLDGRGIAIIADRDGGDGGGAG